jgi:hypothetical protein
VSRCDFNGQRRVDAPGKYKRRPRRLEPRPMEQAKLGSIYAFE